MALRHLVEGECGAANPLVQWTSHFTQEKSMLKVSLLTCCVRDSVSVRLFTHCNRVVWIRTDSKNFR